MKSQTPIDLRLTRRAASGIRVIDSDQPKRNFITPSEAPIKQIKVEETQPIVAIRKSTRSNKELKQTTLEFTTKRKLESTTVINEEKEEENETVKKQKLSHSEVKEAPNTSLPEHIQQELKASFQQEDTPSPPSSLSLEPITPPIHEPIAPYKTYLSPADKKRIENEKSLLVKLRKALDIVITDRVARHRPAFYHQIEPVIRNSTGRSVTIANVCQIIHVAPRLYSLEVKELRDYGGKVTEAFLLGIGQDWSIPLTGKNLEERATLLVEAIDDFFHTHPEPEATIPEAALPRLNLIVDKKEWIKSAKLPPGVRALLDAHEKVKEVEEEKAKPKPTPTGTVKERMAALKARLAAKKAAQNN
ncbi:hypothetical protein EDC96DRAFT_572497 [Choanephora cucurbitarum]|nr:hypothetical protein EDC96DRAFT_572497 [Choanephora cucurbitarum]